MNKRIRKKHNRLIKQRILGDGTFRKSYASPYFYLKSGIIATFKSFILIEDMREPIPDGVVHHYEP